MFGNIYLFGYVNDKGTFQCTIFQTLWEYYYSLNILKQVITFKKRLEERLRKKKVP